MRRRGFCAAIVLIVGCVLAQGAETAKTAQPVNLWLTLYDAVPRGETPAPDDPALMLELRQRGPEWERVWGVARNYNATIHSGHIVKGRFDDQGIALSLEVKIEGDSYSTGGRAKYQVTLTPKAADRFERRWTGTFRNLSIEGRAEAEILPPSKTVVENYAPVVPGEHPRILFRKSDLPRLREKMKTPFGQAAMAKIGLSSGDGDIVGMGLKYQLMGDKRFAEEAITFVEKRIDKGSSSDQFGNNVGDRMEKIAIAYDLCYAAWSPAFRKRVEDYLVWASNTVMFRQKSMNRGINWHVCSNWSAPLYTGVGFAGLALWGEKGDQPARPTPSNTGAQVPAAKNYVPGRGVPVSKFQNGEMPGGWIYVGGFKPAPGEDALAALGGVAKAQPEVGTTVSCGERSEAFRPLSREKDKGYWQNANLMRGKEMIDVTNATGRLYFSTSYFYTIVENDAPRWVQVSTGLGSAAVYLAGVRFEEGDCAHIEPGLYPMMVAASCGWTDPWGRILMQPRLIEVTAEQARTHSAARQTEFEEQLEDWEEDVEEWKRTGGLNVAYLKTFHRSRLMMYLFNREAVGSGGFQAEIGSYSMNATRPPARFAPAYRRVFGEDVSPYPDLTRFLPRKMFAHLYRPAAGLETSVRSGEGDRQRRDGADAIAQDINGTPDISPDFFAPLFPIIPDKWKPAALWAWNRHAGVTGKDSIARTLEWEPVYAFLNYPLDMTPAHPAAHMPLTWDAPDFGFFGFRNQWKGEDDVIAQIFLKARHIGGWNGPNGGTFRLLGLGHVWAYGPTDRNRSRWEENVVMLPDNPEINEGACGRLAYLKTEPDGSGILTIDMNDIYATAQPPDANGRRPRLYEPYGNIRRASAFKDSGITGLRAIAVDYSGKSGAPCLMVLVDKISGGKSKVWTWQLGGGAGKDRNTDPGNLPDTTVEGNTFTIKKPDGATLYATFVTPDNVKLTAEVRQTAMIGGAGSSAGKTLQRPIPGVFATGGDNFFVVATLQRGNPPPVKITGSGLDARVSIGKQTIRFDGKRIVLGE